MKMTNKKSTKRTLLSSVIALLLCTVMLLGTTFAWFTDSVTNGVNQIVAGNLDVELWHSTYTESAGASQWGVGFGYQETAGEQVGTDTLLFLNQDGEPILWEPGTTAVENFRVKNVGSLALKFMFKIEIIGATETPDGKDLTDILSLYIDEINWEENGVPVGTEIVSGEKLGDGYVFEGELLAGENYDFWVGLEWESSDVDNEFNVPGGLQLQLGVTLLATQLSYEKDDYNGNGYDANAQYPTVDYWDGTADASWYIENPTADTYILNSAEDLAGLAALLNGSVALPENAGIPLPGNFEGKTFKLESNIDLYSVDALTGEPVSFAPIGGNGDDNAFSGTFDGQGHTISGLYQSGWAFGYEWGSYGSVGLFGELKDATVKNVTISGAESLVEGGDVGGVAGSASGNCVFENVTVENSVFATYNNGNGGLIGWSGEGSYTFKDIKIAENVVLAGLWGSFDSSIGGVVGQAEPGASYHFENVEVACRLDVYNDVTASYDYYNYRMCGMLIGRMEETVNIDGANYPDVTKYDIVCDNVTVTYGEWANYHYCRAAGARGVRVEAGYSYGGIAEDYDHSNCTVHHLELIEFDQIFGGDQFGVKGLPAYEGVEVIYNNK